MRTSTHPLRGSTPCTQHTARTTAPLAAAGIAIIATAAPAQVASNGLTINVDDRTLLPGESTTIRLEAYFGGTDYAVAGIGTWLRSSEGRAGLGDPRVLAPMNGPGTQAGVLGETGVRGIVAGQLNFHSIYADPTNPMPFWEVTYTAPADVSEPFEVALQTRTVRYDVYIARDRATSESRLDDFAEGAATIRVIPAPAGLLVLGGLLAAPRRRRAMLAGVCAAGMGAVGMGGAALGQTTVGGVIDTDTTWSPAGSPYFVTETIEITGDATLSIVADVEVRFEPGVGMVVGPELGSGSGTLSAVGIDRRRVFFDGGAGLVFGPNATRAQFDPDTGAFLGGSTLQWTSIGNTSPAAGDEGRFAVRMHSSVPYFDNVTVFSLASGAGAVHAELLDPLASLNWGALRLTNYTGPGLLIRGGSEHVIRSLTAQDVSKVGRGTHLVEGSLRAFPEGSWDLDIRGGLIENCDADRLFDMDRDARMRFEGVAFEGCDGIAISGGSLDGLEVIGCRFEGNGVNIDANAENALVRDCEFIDTRDPRGVEIGGRGELVIEDCLFEGNAGPALIPESGYALVRNCRFIANTGGDGPGAVFAGFTTDLVDNHFERNSARTGGAVVAIGGFTKGNTYIGNSATFGGAIATGRVSYIGTPDEPETFIGNTAMEEGGAIHVSGAGVDIVSALFERNTAAMGGAIAASPEAAGLAISAPGGTGVRMIANTASLGADIYVATPAAGGDILAPCVDWGTLDPAAIAERIYDGADDPSLATVRFEPVGPCGCRVDLDGDGALTIFDFLAFQTAFDAGDLETADFDGDGALTLFDFLAFQSEFDAGCE